LDLESVHLALVLRAPIGVDIEVGAVRTSVWITELIRQSPQQIDFPGLASRAWIREIQGLDAVSPPGPAVLKEVPLDEKTPVPFFDSGLVPQEIVIRSYVRVALRRALPRALKLFLRIDLPEAGESRGVDARPPEGAFDRRIGEDLRGSFAIG